MTDTQDEQIERLAAGLEVARAERNGAVAEAAALRRELEIERSIAARIRRDLDTERDVVEVWKKEHAKAHGDWIETRKKCSEARAEVERERDEARAEADRLKVVLAGVREMNRMADEREEARVRELVVERDEARAEVEKLQVRVVSLQEAAMTDDGRQWVDVLRAERDEARAEVERLKAQLQDANENFGDEAFHRGYLSPEDAQRLRNERDEARAEVERLKNAVTLQGGQMRDVRDLLASSRADVARLTAPIDGLSPGPEYTLADVDRIEAVRGKPYERLRATVLELDAVTKLLYSERADCAEGRHRADCAAVDPRPTPAVDVPDLRKSQNCQDCDGVDEYCFCGKAPRRDTPPEQPRRYVVNGVEVTKAEYDEACSRSWSAPDDRPTPPERPRAKHVEPWSAVPTVAAEVVTHVEQPMPTGNGVEVFRVAIAECPSVSLAKALAERERIGIERYGTTLRTHNGRDVVRDLREELADAYVYLQQVTLEQGVEPDHMLRVVRWRLVEAWVALEEWERRRAAEATGGAA